MDGAPDPRQWGVELGYWDVVGHRREPPASTVQAILEAMGAAGPAPPGEPPMRVVSRGEGWPELPAGTLLAEDGSSAELVQGQEPPPDLPFGYHRFEPAGPGRALTLAVCPSACGAAPQGRAWGWSVQLYATRSRESWGIGDFADLRRLARWSSGTGAGFVLVSPVHAPAPGPEPAPSPYFPSSRCFVNPLYLRVEDVPGAGSLAEVAPLAEQARALNSERRIDRTRAWAVKSKALEPLFDRLDQGPGAPDLDRYIARQGWPLDGYTTFCALAERHGLPWQGWPSSYRRPTSQQVETFAASAEGRRRKRYHAWLQWLCDNQMAEASSGADLVCDLAVGVDGEGADAWLWQDVFAMGMRVGAPPDDFNIDGQDWGLTPWDPWKLRGAAYEPYIETLRAAMRHARGLRLDHVMGLFRLFWAPAGTQPSQGTYVRYPGHDLLSLLCLEAFRAGAYVVGEDLGTVEDEVREVLARRGVLSYKLLWFEPGRPAAWPHQALGAVTTHDLPTIAGVWSGSDLTAQRSAGVCPNEEGFASLRRRLEDWTGSSPGRPASEVIEASYRLLAQAPCALLAAVLEDALAVEERPNMPGTIDQWPNWCLAMPVPLEEIEQSPLAAAIAASLSAGAAGVPAGPGRGG